MKIKVARHIADLAGLDCDDDGDVEFGRQGIIRLLWVIRIIHNHNKVMARDIKEYRAKLIRFSQEEARQREGWRRVFMSAEERARREAEDALRNERALDKRYADRYSHN
jgi:hypothetical protein